MTHTYSANDTALLVIDPYNDFMGEGGKLYDATKETAMASGFYDNLPRVIAAIRTASIQVFIVPHRRWRPGDYDGWLQLESLAGGRRKRNSSQKAAGAASSIRDSVRSRAMSSYTSIGRRAASPTPTWTHS